MQGSCYTEDEKSIMYLLQKQVLYTDYCVKEVKSEWVVFTHLSNINIVQSRKLNLFH